MYDLKLDPYIIYVYAEKHFVDQKAKFTRGKYKYNKYNKPEQTYLLKCITQMQVANI